MREKGFAVEGNPPVCKAAPHLLRQGVQRPGRFHPGPEYVCPGENARMRQGQWERLPDGRKDAGDVLRPFADEGQGQVKAGGIAVPPRHARGPEPCLQVLQRCQENRGRLQGNKKAHGFTSAVCRTAFAPGSGTHCLSPAYYTRIPGGGKAPADGNGVRRLFPYSGIHGMMW